MKKKIFKDIKATSIQTLLNQVLGLAVFLITSRYLTKEVYGEMNWTLAILTFTTSILSLRLEQIVVHRVASGETASKLLTLFFGHVLGTGLLLYMGLLLGNYIFPSFFTTHNLLLIIAVSHLLTYFSLPFKQIANGREQYGQLALMSSIAIAIRSFWLLAVIIFSTLTIQKVLTAYIVSSLLEVSLSFYIIHFKMGIRMSREWGTKDYLQLLKKSLPQIGSVVLMASIARIDWILLGIFSNQSQVAEYSFAYKVFELSPLPMLVMAPILLTRLSRYFVDNEEASLLNKRKEIALFNKTQMLFATLLPLGLNLIWAPLMDALTNNKYGAANSFTFLILSLCIPFLYGINFLWSVHFTQNRLKLIFKVSLCTCSIILVGDLIAIPYYQAQGAAVVYLIAMAVEYILFMRASLFKNHKELWQTLLIFTVLALLSGVIAFYITDNVILRLITGLALYFMSLFLSRQLKMSDVHDIKSFIK